MRLGRSALTVLYSPSMTSSESVDLAVTFSLPGVPASSSSICQTNRKFQDFQKNTSIHCRYPACFTLTAFQFRPTFVGTYLRRNFTPCSSIYSPARLAMSWSKPRSRMDRTMTVTSRPRPARNPPHSRAT